METNNNDPNQNSAFAQRAGLPTIPDIRYTTSPLGIIDSAAIKYDPKSGEYSSLFSSTTKFRTTKGYKDNGLPPVLGEGSLHRDDVYNISTSNIIRKLQGIKPIELKFSDFAYLKDYGVYPNNRLVVIRRFPVAIMDDLYSARIDSETSEYPMVPMSTVIGYKTEDEDFIDFTVSEEWTDAEATFTDILNSVGNDFGMKDKLALGDVLEAGINAVPLPGASLLFQRQLLLKLGILTDADLSVIPVGDPNLIKEARTRKLSEDGKAGSGLKGQIKIKLKTTYEQKFINGVDPTIVWMDIMANLLTMGTSNANFYLGKTNGGTNLDKFIKDMVNKPEEKLKKFIEISIASFKDGLNKLKKSLEGEKGKTKDEIEAEAATTGVRGAINKTLDFFGSDERLKKGDSEKEAEEVSDLQAGIDGVLGYVEDFISSKYRVRAFGILAALSGGPSTPWHVTIGNPLRPIFCSGDMECEDVQITLGPVLAFNDLPSSITVEVTLKSARNLGMQEIFSKFNTGGIRVFEKHSESLILPVKGFWTDAKGLGGLNNETGGITNTSNGGSTEGGGATKEKAKEKTSNAGNPSDEEIVRDPNSDESTQKSGGWVARTISTVGIAVSNLFSRKRTR